MCVMRGLYCLHCCWGYIKFQITITVCRFHGGHEIFRGLLQWTEWIVMPIISRYLNNISNVVDHWYLSFKLIQSDKSLCFLNMTPVLPIKCSKPGLSQHGEILRLGGKSLIRILLWQGSGGDGIELWERLIMNYRQPTWLDRNQDWPHFYERMWVVCWKALPYLFTRATLAQKREREKKKHKQLRCTHTKCATHFIIFHFYSNQKKYVYGYWTRKYVYKQL